MQKERGGKCKEKYPVHSDVICWGKIRNITKQTTIIIFFKVPLICILTITESKYPICQ